MIELYSINNATAWDKIVKSIKDWDVYYLSGYVKAFMEHGDGFPQLLYYYSSSLRAVYVYLKRNTAIGGYYDSVSPYGYGGVIFDGDTSPASIISFWNEYTTLMRNEGIVDNFTRYHPILANAESMKVVSDVIDLGYTIAVDLSSPDIIWENIISKNRNVIRKAEKNGVEIRHGKDMALFEDFIRIYNATMDKDNAAEYYYFNKSFYESIHNDLYDHYEMFYAVLNEEIIAMSIILYGNGQMHYHLSGSKAEYRSLAPTNLLLYKAALWGCERGLKTFHLGGGVGSGEDNLYKFKSAFNRKSHYQFSIGKMVFDNQKYLDLVEERASRDPLFCRDSHYFPLYRS